jgi:polyisoprenoid-binding protein YceI
MRSIQTLSIGTLALALVGLPGAARASTWDMDPSHSQIGFVVKHLMITDVHGLFKTFTGTVELDDKDATKSKIDLSIDIGSVNTGDDKRDGHLKSADFFDAEKFPKMTFKSTKIVKAGKDKYKVHGDLTIKDQTKPVELAVEGPGKQVKDPWGGTRSAVTATGKIKRKDFGITWNKDLDGGGVVVGEEVKLELSVELLKKAPQAEASK